jgi:adenosylcobyric acid synthase
MMGVEVCDPDHVEGTIDRLPGLGLLPMTTTMSGEKVTRQVEFLLTTDKLTPNSSEGVGGRLKGYEIHMGETRPFGDSRPQPFAVLNNEQYDGCYLNERCMGTYIHGVLDNQVVVDMLLQPFAGKLAEVTKPFDYQAFKEQQYNRLAAHVRKYVDMERLYAILSDNS